MLKIAFGEFYWSSAACRSCQLSSNELPLRRHADRRSHLVLFAEVDCEVDGAVVSEWRDGRRDPAGPVGGIVEVGHQTWRVTAAGPRRVADRRVQVAARCGRTVVLSPATPPPTSPRTPSNTLRLHLASRRFCAYRHLGLGLKRMAGKLRVKVSRQARSRIDHFVCTF